MDNYLRDRQDITDVITRFGVAIDAKNWVEVAALFHDDAVCILPVGNPFVGRAAILKILRAALDACGPTHHLFSNHLVTVAGDTARASCYVRIYHSGSGDMEDKFEETLGTFQLELTRLKSEWQFTKFEERVQIMLGTTDIFRLEGSL